VKHDDRWSRDTTLGPTGWSFPETLKNRNTQAREGQMHHMLCLVNEEALLSR